MSTFLVLSSVLSISIIIMLPFFRIVCSRRQHYILDLPIFARCHDTNTNFHNQIDDTSAFRNRDEDSIYISRNINIITNLYCKRTILIGMRVYFCTLKIFNHNLFILNAYKNQDSLSFGNIHATIGSPIYIVKIN